MKLQSVVSVVGLSILVSAAPALAALPTVNTFAVTATAVSPVPVTAFTASDSDGTVVGYMVTQTSSKPAAGDARWTSSAWAEYSTNSIGAITLYAWAKDNAGGVSNARTAPTTVVGGHVHTMSQVTGLTTALAGKADVNHNHDAVYQRKYAGVKVVAKSGGDFTDPIAAINSITDSSAANPYLLKIMPGVYDIGSDTLVMKEFVDLEGSGENTTIITSAASSGAFLGTVAGSNNSELRFLTIANTGAGARAAGVVNNATSPKLTNVTVSVTGSSPYNCGIYNWASASAMTDVTVIVSGGTETDIKGILNENNCSITMNGVTVSVTGTVATFSGAIYGIYNQNSFSNMTNVTVTASGSATFSCAVNNESASAVIANSTFTASGTLTNSAIRNAYSSVILTNVTATANGGSNNFGMSNQGDGGGVQVDRSTIQGDGYGLSNSRSPLRIGSSKLVGSINISNLNEPFTCFGSCDGNYAPLNAACE